MKTLKNKKKNEVLTSDEISKRVSKSLRLLDKITSFYEAYGIFMAKAQLVEFELKGLLTRKFKYAEEELDEKTLGWTILELGKRGLRLDFVFLLRSFLEHRNELAHDLLVNDLLVKKLVGVRGQRFAEKTLHKAHRDAEEVIQVYDWLNAHNYLTFKKHNIAGKKILVFIEGVIMYPWAFNSHTQKEIVSQINANPKIVEKRESYIPIKSSVNMLKAWSYQGATIRYVTAATNKGAVAEVLSRLELWDFPKGKLYFREKKELYNHVVERVGCDVLIESDRQYTGGAKEMAYPYLSEKRKKIVKSIVAKEYAGIDDIKI